MSSISDALKKELSMWSTAQALALKLECDEYDADGWSPTP